MFITCPVFVNAHTYRICLAMVDKEGKYIVLYTTTTHGTWTLSPTIIYCFVAVVPYFRPPHPVQINWWYFCPDFQFHFRFHYIFAFPENQEREQDEQAEACVSELAVAGHMSLFRCHLRLHPGLQWVGSNVDGSWFCRHMRFIRSSKGINYH